MKFTAKHVMLVLMSVLLVLVVVMGMIVLDRVADFLQLGGKPSVNTPPSSSLPGAVGSSVGSSAGSSVTSQPSSSYPDHEHDFVKGKTFKATCISSGYTLYECECGKEDIRDFTNPLGHTYGEYTVIEATCTTDGWTERTCSRCNEVEKTNLVAASHNFDEWTDVESADGTPTQENRLCLTCGTIEIRSLDSANTWVLQVSELEALGDFVHYRIVVDLEETEDDPIHDVYSALEDPLRFDCVDDELWIYFSTEEIYTPFSVSPRNTTITFYADGNISLAEPELPPEPDTPGTDTENPDPDNGNEENLPE